MLQRRAVHAARMLQRRAVHAARMLQRRAVHAARMLQRRAVHAARMLQRRAVHAAGGGGMHVPGINGEDYAVVSHLANPLASSSSSNVKFSHTNRQAFRLRFYHSNVWLC